MQNFDMGMENFNARIAVVGLGGQGCNLVNRLTANGIKSADTIAMNTDVGHLNMIKAGRKILLGKDLTKGLGAGGFPEVAAKAVDISRDEITKALEGYDLVFVCAGMGGGTGTGSAAPVAKIAKELGSTVIASVTYPFALERSRKQKADWGLERLTKEADTVIVIENDRLLSYAPNLPIEKSFAIIDNITSNAVKGISDTIMMPSLINIDFADLRNIVKQGGTAVISIGSGSGPNRVDQAINSTRTHPLLNVDYRGAKSALVHKAGGQNMTISETTKIGEGVTEGLAGDANVIFGARVLPELNDQLRIMSIVTGVTPKFGAGSSESTEVSSLRMEGLENLY